MSLRFSIAMVVAGGLAAASASAQERFTPPFGGTGGQQYVLRCPAGAVLTGIAARTGAYVNGIAPICNGQTMPGAGGGGDQRSAVCPADSVVRRLGIISLRSDNHLLKALQLDCRARSNGQQTAIVPLDTPGLYTAPYFQFFGHVPGYPSSVADCGTQPVVGIEGRAGSSVDAIGLICGAAGGH